MILHLLPLMSLLAPAPTRPMALPLTPPSIVADTGSAPDLAQTPLTSELLTRYIAVKKDLNDYWKAPANKALHDSALAHHHVHTITLTVPGFQTPVLPANSFDYVDLTSREPSVAAIFKKDNFEPAQFEPTQLSVMRAGFASEVARLSGKSVDDASSVAGKNTTLVQSHKQELVAVGAFPQLQAQTAGGNMGGGNDDLNP